MSVVCYGCYLWLASSFNTLVFIVCSPFTESFYSLLKLFWVYVAAQRWSFLASPPVMGRKTLTQSIGTITPLRHLLILALIFCVLSYFPPCTFFLTHLLLDLSTRSRMDPFHFQAGSHRRRPNLALIVYVNFMLYCILLQMYVCFCYFWFSFTIIFP